ESRRLTGQPPPRSTPPRTSPVRPGPQAEPGGDPDIGRRRWGLMTPTSPLVSAIVVNWNGGTMLDDCLASLFAQTWPQLEVIVVDNASADGSADRARARYGDRLRIVQNQRNEGFARGNNQGFAIA